MKEQIAKILTTFSEFWKAQEKKRKLLYIGVLAGVVVLAIVIVSIANIPRSTVLFAGLDTTDSMAMMTELGTMGVVAKVSDDGGTITVPEDSASTARAQLAVLGYPKNPLNYDEYNKNVNMFSTDFQNQEQARIAAQLRAEGTLKALDGVTSAIVTFNIPQQKDTVISVNVKPSTASVVVGFRAGFSPSDKQVSGMFNIVRTSIGGLVDDNITITDTTGNPLIIGEGRTEDTIAMERNRLRFKGEFEATLIESITDLLTPIFGEGNLKVAANAVLNYDAQVTEKTEHTPSHEDGSGMISQEDERNASGTDGAGDVVGATPNADGTYPTEQGGAGGAYSDNEKSTTYLVNTAKTQIEKEGFTIDSLTIAASTSIDTLSEADQASITTLIARAAGITEAAVSLVNMPKNGAGDSITTSGFPFGMSRNMFFVLMAALLVMIIIFTVMYMGVSKKARRKRRAIEQQIYDAALAAGGAGQVDGFFNADAADFNYKVASLSEHSGEFDDSKEAAVRKEIGDFAKNSPEIVGALLKSWLREDDENGSGSSRSGGSRGAGRR